MGANHIDPVFGEDRDGNSRNPQRLVRLHRHGAGS